MKRGWAHFILMKSGVVHEGWYLFSLRGVTFWRPIEFAQTNDCPHALAESAIEFALPVVEMKLGTTAYDYHDALTDLSLKQT